MHCPNSSLPRQVRGRWPALRWPRSSRHRHRGITYIPAAGSGFVMFALTQKAGAPWRHYAGLFWPTSTSCNAPRNHLIMSPAQGNMNGGDCGPIAQTNFRLIVCTRRRRRSSENGSCVSGVRLRHCRRKRIAPRTITRGANESSPFHCGSFRVWNGGDKDQRIPTLGTKRPLLLIFDHGAMLKMVRC